MYYRILLGPVGLPCDAYGPALRPGRHYSMTCALRALAAMCDDGDPTHYFARNENIAGWRRVTWYPRGRSGEPSGTWWSWLRVYQEEGTPCPTE